MEAIKAEGLDVEPYVLLTLGQPHILIPCKQESIPREEGSSSRQSTSNSVETVTPSEALEVTNPPVRSQPLRRMTVSYLTDLQVQRLERSLAEVVQRSLPTPFLTQGRLVANPLGQYRLELSVELTEEEGDRMLHQLAGLGVDRAETPPGFDHLYIDWEGGTDLGPEYDENMDV